MKYKNPILPGFHPDPSICRVGDIFYLATSSFHYFPGIPLWRSRNLVDWKLAGHGISRPGQMDLTRTGASRGLYAPTIRERGGSFYIACTEVDRAGNFIITAPSIDGPWSDPVMIALGGVDPSLFFDDDGVAYLCTSCSDGETAGIALSVINPASGEILAGPKVISCGSGGRWPEGPHIYKKNGLYYLLISEGGTEYGHMLTVFRAASPWGPYEACPRNPVLSHRDFAWNPIQCVGHGDLVDDAAGNWWLVCLGVRPIGSVLLHNLGRETYLAPVSWGLDGWPLVGDHGVLNLKMEGPLPGPAVDNNSGVSGDWHDEFAGPQLSSEWSSLRARLPGVVEMEKQGGLLLSGGGVSLSLPMATPAFVGRPQQAFDCIFKTSFDFDPSSEESEAGIVAYYDDSYHYEAFVTRRSGARVIDLRKHIHDTEAVAATVSIPQEGTVHLFIETSRECYRFFYACGEASGELGSGMTAGLCTEGTWRMSFTGVFLGLYCVRGRALFHDSSCVDVGQAS
ncbi:MAG: glycoside hydrolase family 43 protein [Spirochaetaceae bacterium]|nr:glycoside hydrolase family 43 protein [Spirochaetaceae bacterium]